MKTVEMLDSLKKKFPTADEAFEWPLAAAKEKKWSEAAQRWAVLREVYPKNPTPWYYGANAYLEAGELEVAQSLLDQAQKWFPNHPNAFTGPALVAMRMEKWDIAEGFLEKARKWHSDLIQTWLVSAQCFEGQGDLGRAFNYIEEACRIGKGVPVPHIQRAEMAMRAGQWENALGYWKIVRQRFPDHPAGYLNAAEAARRLGRVKEARRLTMIHQYGRGIFGNDLVVPAKKTQQSGHFVFLRMWMLIWTKAVFNLRSEVSHNYLSYGWWVLEPLLHMGVYYVVFGLLLNRGGENFALFLLTGLIPWMWFLKSVTSSSNSIVAGQNLMIQVGIPSIVFPLTKVLQTMCKQIPIFLLLFGFVWLLGFSPGLQWLALVPVIIVQAIITVAISLIVAAIIPFVRDLSYLVPTGLTFLMFLSGIFYDYRNIGQEWQHLFLINPIAFLIDCYRQIILHGVAPDLWTLACWGSGGLAACSLILIAYARLRYIYPRVVLG